MSIFQDIASEIGLPTGAIALAIGLVRGAKALETDANPRALKYVSDLLTEGDLKSIGKAGARLVPFIFDKIFGSKPISFRFISRSIVATTLFWTILTLVKRPNWNNFVGQLYDLRTYYAIVVPFWYLLDWLSLAKARFLIRIISQKYAILSSLSFMIADIICSYALSFIADMITSAIYSHKSLGAIWLVITSTTASYADFSVIGDYYSYRSEYFGLLYVLTPSTLLTSLWTFLLFVSCLIAQLLVPIDYLRQFTAFWFRDVEHHPLTAIAKVAATLIVVGAVAIKAVRWIY